jgi:hypothetical protein
MSDFRHFDTAHVNFLRAIHAVGGVPCERAPQYFFPEDLPDPDLRRVATKIARTLCGECPIKETCFEYALETNQRHGIWAGTTPSER